MSAELKQEKALIFRATHIQNLRWALRHGLHCSRSGTLDPNFISVGNSDLIAKRTDRTIPPEHTTCLSDYIPFYFTPFSPMMYNISTGWGGIQKRPNKDIVIIVSSLHLLGQRNVPFLFTDRHAFLNTAEFFTDIADINKIDWQILQKRDFKHDSEDPGKMHRYMAEALVRDLLPIDALLGLACYDSASEAFLKQAMQQCGTQLKVVVKPGWYF